MQKNLAVCSFTLGDSGLTLGPVFPLGPMTRDLYYDGANPHLFWLPDQPDTAYFLSETCDRSSHLDSIKLLTISLRPDRLAVTQTLDLLPEFKGKTFPPLTTWIGNRLYLVRFHTPQQLVALQLDDPAGPKVVQCLEFDAGRGLESPRGESPSLLEVRLLPLAGLSPAQRVDASIRLTVYSNGALKDNTLVLAQEDDLRVYRVGTPQNDRIPLEMIGQYRMAFMERLLATEWRKLIFRDGRLYALTYFNTKLAVYDVRDLARIRRVGYYSAASAPFYDMQILDDGSVLLTGTKVQVLAPVQPRLAPAKPR